MNHPGDRVPLLFFLTVMPWRKDADSIRMKCMPESAFANLIGTGQKKGAGMARFEHDNTSTPD